jgi:hypothetical protein
LVPIGAISVFIAELVVIVRAEIHGWWITLAEGASAVTYDKAMIAGEVTGRYIAGLFVNADPGAIRAASVGVAIVVWIVSTDLAVWTHETSEPSTRLRAAAIARTFVYV